jgi:hypothetical protein
MREVFPMRNKLNSKSTNVVEQIASAQALMAGFKKRYAKQSLLIGGKTYTCDEIVTTLQKRIDLILKVQSAFGAYRTTVQDLRAHKLSSRALFDGCIKLIEAMHGTQGDVLNDFGLEPRKRRATTVHTAAQAVQSRLATRTARNTMGSRQKLAVRGSSRAPKT